MSADPNVAQARRWLEEQLVGLAGLRNAQPRDPGFRNWRQNTLTVLQRIWPNDTQHSERFRRIPFSMPGHKPNARAMRDWYSRGCTDAAKVLRALLEEVDTVGVPGMGAAPAPRGIDSEVAEDDFPTVELPSTDAAPSAKRPDVDDENMIDLGSPRSPLGAPTASMLDRQPDEPLPPTLKVAVPRAATPTSAARTPDAPAPPRAAEPPAAASEKPRATPAPSKRRAASKPARRERTRGGSRERLKDMLGLAKFEADDVAEAATPPGSAAPAPEAAPDAPGTGSVDASPPRRRSDTRVDLATMISPEFRDAPAMERKRAAAKAGEAAPAVAAAPADRDAAAPPPAEMSATTASDAADDDPDAIDPEAFARATEAFFLSSPVLGSTGRPVQRVSDGTSFLDPDAVAVATLAAEVGRLAVPESQRASLRAHLLDLARQLDSGSLEWTSLRESVTTAMEHPEVARRLMPVLLPWLDRAA